MSKPYQIMMAISVNELTWIEADQEFTDMSNAVKLLLKKAISKKLIRVNAETNRIIGCSRTEFFKSESTSFVK